ncbi:MAG TPA: DUF1269 domain-containing protein [Candidatus Deferrimicrobium sp.]|nr:DUF1269 domain-containing protein [Candidatus Deferrimicrobium sp.]
MSQLLVITFESRESAGQARDRLKSLESAHGAHIDDVAVVEKDAEGKVHVHHGFDRTTAGGAVVGGALGLLLAIVFFPVAGLAIGAAFGGLIGHSLHHNIDKKLVEDVTRDLTADTSALFVLGSGNASAVVGALEPYNGKVYQTTLDPEAEAQIQAALDKGGEG